MHFERPVAAEYDVDADVRDHYRDQHITYACKCFLQLLLGHAVLKKVVVMTTGVQACFFPAFARPFKSPVCCDPHMDF